MWLENRAKRPADNEQTSDRGDDRFVLRVKRSRVLISADDRATHVAIELGRAIAAARAVRTLSQAELGTIASMSQSAVSRVELGQGDGLSLRAWVRLATVVGLPVRFEFGRDPLRRPVDAGHLDLQELLLRRGAAQRYEEVSTETPTGHGWVDVSWRSAARHLSIVLEAWNVIGDVGSGLRSFVRKVERVQDREMGQGSGHRVAGCWVVRSNERNRRLLSRYPHVFTTALPGSSRGWVAALEDGFDPPRDPGLVLCDPDRDRITEWRRVG